MDLTKFGNDQKSFKYCYDCRINSIYEVLRYYGTEISPLKLMALSELYDFTFCYINLPDLEIEHLPYAVASLDNIQYKVFDKLGVKYEKKRWDGSKEAEKEILKVLGTGTPIMMRTDHRALLNSGQENDTIPVRHLALPVLLGYSEDFSKVFFFWTSQNNTPPFGMIDKNRFNQYRGSVCLPYSPDYECCYIADAGSLQKLTGSDIDQKVRESLTAICRKMMESGRKDESMQGFATEQYYGVEAMQKFGEEFRNLLVAWKDNPNDPETDGYTRFVVAFTKSNFWRGSMSAYREELGEIIKGYGKEHNLPKLSTQGDKLFKLGSLWKEIIYTCVKSTHGNGIEKNLMTISKDIAKATEQEAKIYEAVLCILEQTSN